jgi:predicted nuclease of restriction endonuclease-like (RecB) superfamily
MIMMYWDIGRMIDERQKAEGWGARIIPRLSKDIRNELPEVKGFSERNLKLMVQFFHEYLGLALIGQPAVAQSNSAHSRTNGQPTVARSDITNDDCFLVLQIPWAHNVIIMEKIKAPAARTWYIRQTLENGWSRNVLAIQISGNAYERHGKAVTNFESALPQPQSDLVQQALKDPYVFDFLTLAEPFKERELEIGLIQHLQRFLIEMGQGFAFVGRQYHVDVGDEDFYIDLLFYHLKLRCFIAIDLKKGDFKPEYSGKMNFYCSVIDDILRHPTDQPTIGLILCQKKNKVIAEYALRDVNKPIGISEYELTKALPTNLRSSLPSIEEIESEMNFSISKVKTKKRRPPIIMELPGSRKKR